MQIIYIYIYIYIYILSEKFDIRKTVLNTYEYSEVYVVGEKNNEYTATASLQACFVNNSLFRGFNA